MLLRAAPIFVVTALGCVFIAAAAGTGFVDPDLFHQMALIREALARGSLPRVDTFAYTSTVEPLVHHEWGMGVISYVVATTFGATGLGLLRDALALGIGLFCVLCARRRGADWPTLWVVLPLPAFFLLIGITTVRAQMFTLLFLSMFLWLLELDRAGQRRWIWAWLVAFVVWVNVHAGFVVGMIALGGHTVEEWLRGRPIRHLVLLGLAMAALITVNPYGWEYYAYLWHGLTMQRPLIAEWQSILHTWWGVVMLYAMSLLLVVYAVLRRGWRAAVGILFLLAAAYAAARHQRHLSIFAVAWACCVPALLQGTPISRIFARILAPEGAAGAAVAGFAALAGIAVLVMYRPWVPVLPVNPDEHRSVRYPAGAVAYLEDQGFRGKLVTPFIVGAYVSWKLHPAVQVSLDSRFEAAFDPELLAEHLRFETAAEGWSEFLEKYPPDAILVDVERPISAALADAGDWQRVYRDDVYAVHMRSAIALPFVDRSGERLVAEFP